MVRNRGKQFEAIIRKSFEKIKDVSIVRLPDQMGGYLGAKNICDFIVYKYPHEYYIECKTVKGNRLPYSNISEAQWQGLLEKSKIKGVYAGVLCWWIDKDVTMYIPIQELQINKELGYKSVPWDAQHPNIVELQGKKKRTYYDYDMKDFFKEVTKYAN